MHQLCVVGCVVCNFFCLCIGAENADQAVPVRVHRHPEPREPNLGYAIIVEPLSDVHHEIGPQNAVFLYGTIINCQCAVPSHGPYLSRSTFLCW